MGKNIHTTALEFTISGTGNAVGEFDFLPQVQALTGSAATYVKASGRVWRFFVRQAAGGGATAATFYMFNRNQRSVTSPSTSAQDKHVFRTSAVPLTASATVASLDTEITAGPVFKDSLTLVADVTAVGAWTLSGYVELTEG